MASDAPAGDGVDVVVIGAGIVGIACAAALARGGRSVVAIERHDGILRETSSRNSEVVHAGIYYPTASLKATSCVEGRRALERRCARDRVPYRRIGKWIVATSDGEVERLEVLRARGEANGVEGLVLRDGQALRRAEPQVRGKAALWSPQTGIVDGHALALSHLAEAEAHGAVLLLRHEVRALHLSPVVGSSADWEIEVVGPDGRATVRSAAVVNCAGLAADRVAAWAGIDIDRERLRQFPCKGDYFALAPSARLQLRSLIYPLPGAAGLGVHATLDLAGRIRFGPDAEYIDAPRYDVDPLKAEAFAQAIARYLPSIRADDLAPDQAGVRPRLCAPGEEFRDFEVREESALGLPGLVDCIGIESPGLTAAEAIGRRVVELLGAL